MLKLISIMDFQYQFIFCTLDNTSSWKRYEVHSIDLWLGPEYTLNETRVHIPGVHLVPIRHRHSSKWSSNRLYFTSTWLLLASMRCILALGTVGISFLQQFLRMGGHKDAFYHMIFASVRSKHFSCKHHGKLVSYLEMATSALRRRICILLPHFARRSFPCDMVPHCTWCRSSSGTRGTWSYGGPCGWRLLPIVAVLYRLSIPWRRHLAPSPWYYHIDTLQR